MRLLGSGGLLSTDILADVGRIGGLRDDVFEGAPPLASDWRSALVGELGINAGSKLGDGALDKGALRVPGAEEDSVHNEQDPRTFLEQESRTKDAEPEGNLEDGNEGHAAIVVLLDELANCIRQARRGLRTWRSSSRRRLDGRQQIRAHIGSDVEH